MTDASFRSALPTPVTWTFLALCGVVTLIGLFWPPWYAATSGIVTTANPRVHFWQPFTACLQHGWPGVPAIVHFLLNMVLIALLGPTAERLLGSLRFALLCVLSATANALLVYLTAGVNGSSLVIWSWGPIVWWGLRETKDNDVFAKKDRRLLKGLLWLMYLFITLGMSVLPYIAGWRGKPLLAFWLGNQYHLVATAVGLICMWFWRRRIAARTRPQQRSSKYTSL